MAFKAFTMAAFGIIAGIYIDQNYSVPHVSTFINFAMEWIKTLEENLRKP
jgi:hypothetical protein